MYNDYAILITFIPLPAMIISDFRQRRISVVWLSAFYLASVGAALLMHGWQVVVFDVLLNLFFLLLLFGSLHAYIHIRRSRNPSFGKAIGMGDLLFLPALAPLFELKQFAWFLTISFIAILAVWSLMRLFGRGAGTIPLVGAVGICFILYHSIFSLPWAKM